MVEQAALAAAGRLLRAQRRRRNRCHRAWPLSAAAWSCRTPGARIALEWRLKGGPAPVSTSTAPNSCHCRLPASPAHLAGPPRRQRPASGPSLSSVRVLTNDGEWFPVKRALLRPCIALTKAVRSEGESVPEVAVDVDTLIFDRWAGMLGGWEVPGTCQGGDRLGLLLGVAERGELLVGRLDPLVTGPVQQPVSLVGPQLMGWSACSLCLLAECGRCPPAGCSSFWRRWRWGASPLPLACTSAPSCWRRRSIWACVRWR